MAPTTETIDGNIGHYGAPGTSGTAPEAHGHPAGRDNPAEATAPPRPKYRSWGSAYAKRLLVADVLALLLASIVVHLVRLPYADLGGYVEDYFPYVALTAILVVVWLQALRWSGSRDIKIIGYGAGEYKRVIHATLAVFGLTACLAYIFRIELSRSYLLIMLPVGLLALLFSRFGFRRWLHRKRLAGEYLSRTIAVGNVHTVTELLRDLRRAPQAGYLVVGVCINQPTNAVDADGGELLMVDGVPVVGGLDNITEVVRACAADSVAVTATASFGPSRVRELSWELEKTDAELILAPALTNIAGPRIQTQPVAGLPLIHVDRPSYRGANQLLKRLFDIAGALLLLLVFAPVFAAVAIAIRATSTGPVFFRQERVGINGAVFQMIKFRSMVVDAEARLSSLKDAHRDAGNTVLFKMKSDPRITPVGRFLRRFSLDELPQLLNVATGDMSLVGPRPPLAAEVDLYGDTARRRLLVKPGMTGMWQVSGRSDLSWDDSVNLDVYYVENWSITGDLVIIWKTAKAVVSSSGAY